MPRKRADHNVGLPKNLRCRKGYFSYLSQDGREIGLGRDRRKAISEAISRNLGKVSDGLFTEEQIVSASRPMELVCGVYFLVSGAKVVYVGQSTNVHGRLARHLLLDEIQFNRVHIMRCDRSKLDALEAHYIEAFSPAYNRQLRSKALRMARAVYRRRIGDHPIHRS